MIEILCAMLEESEGIVLEDEIETSFYHEPLSRIWSVLANISKENQVQMRVTTQSYEYPRADCTVEDSQFGLEKDAQDSTSCVYTLDEWKTALSYGDTIRIP